MYGESHINTLFSKYDRMLVDLAILGSLLYPGPPSNSDPSDPGNEQLSKNITRLLPLKQGLLEDGRI